MAMIEPDLPRAYDLFHQTIQTFSNMEMNGIRVDVKHCKNEYKRLGDEISVLRKKAKETEEIKRWKKKYGDKFNLDSNEQLADIFFNEFGIEPRRYTDKGNPSTDKEALMDLEEAGFESITDILKMRKFDKLRNTYLKGIIQETTPDGILHPMYGLNIARTFRSNASNPNSQNFPKRDKESLKIVRSAFIPRKGHHLISNDFGGIEVKGACWYHCDPVMLDYLWDESKDMHADMAMQCYLLDSIDKDDPNEKDIRYCGKNKFVFPEFYGDYWKSCAHALWHAIDDMKLKLKDGTPLKKHLRNKKIKTIRQFENHIKEVENDFWNNRFKVYQEWKDRQVEFYVENGYVPLLTGFKCTALMDKKQAINYPIQGVAAHTLFKSLVMTEEEIKRAGMKSLLVLQIHDDQIADVPEKEVEDYIELSKHVMIDRMKEEWNFINTPLEVDPEITPTGKSWVDAVDYYKKYLKDT